MRRSLFHKLNVLERSRLSKKKSRLPGFKWRSSTSSAASRLLRRPESCLLYITNSQGVQPLLWYHRHGRGQPDSELLHHLHIACSVIAEPMWRVDVWFRMKTKSCSFHWNIWTWRASWLVQSLRHRFRGSFVPRFTAKDSKDNNSSQVNQMQRKCLIKTSHRSQECFS